MSRSALVSEAERTIRAGSRSFRMASRLFDRPTRERAWLLYCWCRHCDDQCDGQALGYGRAAPGSVAEVEANTLRVLAGERVGALPFDALAQVLAECAIPRRYIEDHLTGFRLDAQGWRPQDGAALLAYCYHVAGAVGCMMAVVMGVPPDEEETLQRASDLGIAFQLANIARDLREDQEAGRCYLPAEWLAEEGLDEHSLTIESSRPALARLAGRLVELAGRYEASAREGVDRLPFRSRWAVLAAARIYGAIGRRVADLGPAAWDRRVTVRRREKLAFLVPALAEAAGLRRTG